MSAVAATEYAAPHADLHLVTLTEAQLADREMYRWMTWFGLPSLVAAIFMAVALGTGQMLWVGGAVAGVISAVGTLIWLSLSTCTNK
jgi:hypothetical protein